VKEINKTYKNSKMQFESDIKQFRDAEYPEELPQQNVTKPAKTPSFAENRGQITNGNPDSDDLNDSPTF
jgi:hypothetical protein